VLVLVLLLLLVLLLVLLPLVVVVLRDRPALASQRSQLWFGTGVCWCQPVSAKGEREGAVGWRGATYSITAKIGDARLARCFGACCKTPPPPRFPPWLHLRPAPAF